MSDSPELIRSFLAGRDVRCPGCGYNLRGISEPTCPECGLRIELALSQPARGHGYLWFALLALCWVLTASTMNSVRWWQNVENEATASQWVQVMSTPSMTVQGGPPQFISGSAPSIVAIPSATSGGSTVIGSFSGIRMSIRPTYTWSVVSNSTWAAFGFWVGLGLLAGSAATVCLIRRRRFDAESPPRGLMAAAILLFALYAGYHFILFASEYIA